jgi:hypothetical protein
LIMCHQLRINQTSPEISIDFSRNSKTFSYLHLLPQKTSVLLINNSASFPTDLDIYNLEDILEELRELESRNRFQEGDIISKSSNKRVKRKSGKLKFLS